METIVGTIERLVDWCDENICQKITLKYPPTDEKSPTGGDYTYTSGHPACFPMFVPDKDKLPTGITREIPSMCVRVTGGEDGLQTGTLDIELCLAVWNPGIHGQDILNPVSGQSLHYREWTGTESKAYFDRNADGWYDLWNWMDLALREIESVESIDSIEIDKAGGIKFGPLKDENGIPDYYPYWFGTIGFSVIRPIVRTVKNYNDYL